MLQAEHFHLRVSGTLVKLTHKRNLQATAMNDKVASLGPLGVKSASKYYIMQCC